MKATNPLYGKRIFLAPLRKEDEGRLFGWTNDPSLAYHSSYFRPVDWRSHINWLERTSKDQSRVVFTIRMVKTDELIGMVQLKDIHSVNRSAELTIQIPGERNRGKGYGTEAVILLIKYAWRDLNLRRVELKVLTSNVTAIKTYEAAGLQIEGTLRSCIYVNGEWNDMHLMGVIRDID